VNGAINYNTESHFVYQGSRGLYWHREVPHETRHEEKGKEIYSHADKHNPERAIQEKHLQSYQEKGGYEAPHQIIHQIVYGFEEDQRGTGDMDALCFFSKARLYVRPDAGQKAGHFHRPHIFDKGGQASTLIGRIYQLTKELRAFSLAGYA
jgi:hypothetical protein